MDGGKRMVPPSSLTGLNLDSVSFISVIFCWNMLLGTNTAMKDTDFIAAGGPDGYAWNVTRAEADELLFKHAGECGVKIFDATKVTAIEFDEPHIHNGTNGNDHTSESEPSQTSTVGRPVSATWTRKDGTTGTISFKYLVDATGRQGLVSTKYLKNRKFNQGLKNIASWGYWRGGSIYAQGTHMEDSPYFEALTGASTQMENWLAALD
jgi:2-polyprenyl-6-methoxyphenol hydroxylase-like FAD-dependent oxidoreductase